MGGTVNRSIYTPHESDTESNAGLHLESGIQPSDDAVSWQVFLTGDRSAFVLWTGYTAS